MKLPRKVRWFIFRERVLEEFDRAWHRPICWVRGHDPMHKFGLRDGTICRCCGKYMKTRR